MLAIRMIVACVTILFAYLTGFSQGQDCVVNRRCPEFLEKVPECKKDPKEDDLAKCIANMLSDCHTQNQAAQQMHNARLNNEVICDNPDLAKDFMKHKDCWPKLQTCKISFGDVRNKVSGATTDEKEKICMETKQMLEECKIRPDLIEECKEMDRKFLEKALEKSTCGCCTLISNVSLLIVTILLAVIGHSA